MRAYDPKSKMKKGQTGLRRVNLTQIIRINKGGLHDKKMPSKNDKRAISVVSDYIFQTTSREN